MAVKEMLVELLQDVEAKGFFGYGTDCHTGEIGGHDMTPEDIADYLVENGVTFHEWIPVSERLPDSNRTVLVSALTKHFKHRHTLMATHVGHHEFTTEDIELREYEGDTEYDEENDCFWIPECWYEVNAIEDNGNWIIDSEYDVTHWMPLPNPPKEDL